MPAGEWNTKGTKQGIYMFGPDGEYLEGAHAASGSAAKLAERLARALERWESVRTTKGYANLPVPPAAAVAPPELDALARGEHGLILRVSLRDLPRGGRDDSGRRFSAADRAGKPWLAFTEWAWNQNWLGVRDARGLLPRADLASQPEDKALDGAATAVDAGIVDQLFRTALVDNVRGQNGVWRAEDVHDATLTVREVARREDPEHGPVRDLEYEGHGRMDDGNKRFAPTLYGRATWSERDTRFVAFQLVATGERAGAGPFNQRGNDKGPAPMGIALELFAPAGTPSSTPSSAR
ncbi:MAG: hypothetical protein R3F49_15645 [Planctomycetota bacterium]